MKPLLIGSKFNQRVWSLIAILFMGCFYVLNNFVSREMTLGIWGLLLFPSLVYIGFLFKPRSFYLPFWIWIGIITRFGLIFSFPNLSDDYFRFFWDGMIHLEGISPFVFTPESLVEGAKSSISSSHPDLFSQLNSPSYFSVYTPIIQWVFYVSSYLGGGDMLLSIRWMKVSLFVSEMGTLFFMLRLLPLLGIPTQRVLWYFLNPLIINEVVGNLHFEGLMIFFLSGAMFFVAKNKLLKGGLWWGLAVSAKLLPLMFLPLFIKRLSFKDQVNFFGIIGSVFLILLIPFFDFQSLVNYGSSLSLYFAKFEFNASIYYFLRGVFGGGINRILSIAFPVVIFLTILYKSKREITPSHSSLLRYSLLFLFLYFILATTVHPWYITTLVFLACFSHYYFPFIWSLLIPLTYVTYCNSDYNERYLVLFIEYGSLFLFLVNEYFFHEKKVPIVDFLFKSKAFQKVIKWTLPKRLSSKLRFVLPYIKKEDKILDLGTGTGALCNHLLSNGFDVAPLDVKDQSLFPEVRPMIYDGKNIPFESREFDVTLLITVLHHCPQPVQVLKEAKRVSSKIIVIEDIYHNTVQKWLTFWMDRIVNLQFFDHPHSNKTHQEWMEVFDNQNLKVVNVTFFRTLGIFSQVVYELECIDE